MLDSSTPSARPQRGWRPTKSFWIVAMFVLLLVLSAASSGGFGSVLVMLGIVALLTGLYALLFKRRSWVGIPHRKSAALVAGSGVIASFVGGGIVGATAAPSGSDVVVVSESSQSATATPTETNPANSTCLTEDESRTYRDEVFICTASDNELVWLTEAESKELVAQKQEAAKAAAEKAAKAKAAAEKVAADKLAAEKAAAAKAAADKAAADKAAADKAADKAAAEEAARKAAQAPAPAAPATGYVHPGSFCSGGAGVSKTGKPMVCAPGSDGRMRWQGA